MPPVKGIFCSIYGWLPLVLRNLYLANILSWLLLLYWCNVNISKETWHCSWLILNWFRLLSFQSYFLSRTGERSSWHSSSRVGSAGCSGVASDWDTSAALTLTAAFELAELRAKTARTVSAWYASNISLSLRNGVDEWCWFEAWVKKCCHCQIFLGICVLVSFWEIIYNFFLLSCFIDAESSSFPLINSPFGAAEVESLTRLAHFPQTLLLQFLVVLKQQPILQQMQDLFQTTWEHLFPFYGVP